MIQAFQVVLLAGGKGQGLYPLTERYTKAMIPIGNKPLIAYQLEFLEKYGFLEVIILSRHSKYLEKYLNCDYKGKMKIDIKEINEEITSNVDALKQVWNKINRDFILITCDIITDFDLDNLLDQHLVNEATITMLLKENNIKVTKTNEKKKENKNDDVDDYDVVLLEEKTNRVLQIKNNYDVNDGISIKKPIVLNHQDLTICTHLYDCHLYVFNIKIMDYLKHTTKKFMNIKENLVPFLIDNQYNKKLCAEVFHEVNPEDENQNISVKKNENFIKVFAYLANSSIYCKRITEITDFMKVNQDLFIKPLPNCLNFTKNNDLAINEPKKADDKKEKKPTDFLVGENNILGEKIMISKSIIGKNCVISDNVKISKSIIMNNVTIENDCIIQDSIISSKSIVKAKNKLKEVVSGYGETLEVNVNK